MLSLSLLADLMNSTNAIGLVVCVAILFSPVMLLMRRYKRCPSNRVLVIFGRVGTGNSARCIHGGAALVIPVIQDYAFLSLEPIQIAVPLKDALSAENIRVEVPSVFTVAIGTQPEIMQNAAIRLLGLTIAQIKQQAEDIIFGQLRQVIASMRIDDINRDRDKFLQSIQHSLEPELRKIGLVLINVNITDIRDESGYIKALGQKAASQALQQARGDVAEQEREGEVRVAEAERQKVVSVANAHKLREIGMREASREQAVRVAVLQKEQQVGEQTAALDREAQIKLAQREQAVRIAELDKEQKIGEQTAAFEREAQIKDAEQKMRIALADANAKAVAGEAQAQAEIAAAQAVLMVKKSEAYQQGETSKREAEAAVLEAQNRAMAKAAIAEAERVEAERRAAVEAPAKAEKARVIVEAQAEAEKRRIEAEGDAAAIFARLEAEAKGQYEILAKKGEGLQRIVEACGGAQQAYQLLMLEHLDNLASTAAQAIANIKFDKVVVWENGGQNGQTNTANFLQGMARSLPPMMQVMKDIGGVEMPDYLAKMAGDGAAHNGHPATVAAGNGDLPAA
jgi:flotillin